MSRLGIAATSYLSSWQSIDTLKFLEHSHELAASGIQSPINGDPAQLRARADQLSMYIEAMIPLPHERSFEAFEQGLKTAQAAGAVALRAACLGTRRYETFSSLSGWQAFVEESHRSLASVVPLLDRFKIPLGLENHKDWTADEMTALLKTYDSEYLGCCLDFGNNIALLDEPMEAIQKLAPFTVTTHLKNMAVEPAPDGFWMSEVFLNDGIFDVAGIIGMIRKARPKTRFLLEVITRDPLHIPCLTDQYWATFPERSGLYLARTLRLIQERRSVRPLPRVSQLSQEEQRRAEDMNVIACMQYASENLSF